METQVFNYQPIENQQSQENQFIDEEEDMELYPYIAKAVLSYIQPERMDILSFVRGEQIKIIGEHTSGWLRAVKDDKEGFVPSKYFRKLSVTTD